MKTAISIPDEVFRRLTTRIATLPGSSMARIDAGLRLTLALGQ